MKVKFYLNQDQPGSGGFIGEIDVARFNKNTQSKHQDMGTEGLSIHVNQNHETYRRFELCSDPDKTNLMDEYKTECGLWETLIHSFKSEKWEVFNNENLKDYNGLELTEKIKSFYDLYLNE